MKLFRKKSSPKEGSKQRRSSGYFDGRRRRSSASKGEEKHHLLETSAIERESEVSKHSTSPSSMRSHPQGDRYTASVPEIDSIVNCVINVDRMKNEEKCKATKSSESVDSAHESAQRVMTEHATETIKIGPPKVSFASDELETREDPPGDQNYQYGVSHGDSADNTDIILKEVSEQAAPPPRKTAKKSKIINFLLKGSPLHKNTPSKDKKTDSLNTTIETSRSSDSDDPAALSSSSQRLESRDSGDSPKEGRTGESTEKKTPVRTGPVEITNVNLSRLIKHKNAPKKEPETPILKPLKANRSRPRTMSMSKRNEEQFQRYIQRQNRGRKVRESQFVPSFH
ncbi:unnamed protein product [Cylindrotheca closterium]|uniref:Uncharacterized protein n=1 Tax=Cylindrotheca closterium TaxID=2856 RepID=A0AAD2FTG5_9STRA|nr:unnamed protein product [Cylindrotheca closterium]